MGDNSVFNSLGERLILIVVLIGITPFFVPYVFAMECQQGSDSSYELILDCKDTIDVKKEAMELMYGDVSRFSSSLDGAKVYDVRFEDTATFATLEIPLPLVDDLKSDVKFTKASNYFLEFLNGDLGGSSLLISLKEITGYDGTKNGASEVSFSFQIKKVPCFVFGLKCGTAEDFEYALDRGLFLIESKAKELQGTLNNKNENQINSISLDIKSKQSTNQKENKEEFESDKNNLKVPPMADSNLSDEIYQPKMEGVIIEGFREIEAFSPLHQISLGINPQDVKCNEGLHLIFKATDYSPACVKPSTAQKLLVKGWIILGNT